MKTPNRQLKRRNDKLKLAALPLSFVLLGLIVQGASAQGLQGLGMEQDSLLPPEVVPVDPAVSARMSRNQTVSHSNFDTTMETENVPGLVPTYAAGGPNSSYKKMQKAMNDSMHGRAAMPAFANNANQLNQINANVPGHNPYLVPMGTNPVPNQAAQDLAAQNMVAVNSPVSDGPGFGQSQTLTGGSTNPMVRRDTRGGGASNALGSMSGLLKIPSTFLGPGIGFGGFAGGGR